MSYDGAVRCRNTTTDQACWVDPTTGVAYMDMGNSYYAKALFSLFLSCPPHHEFEDRNECSAGDIVECVLAMGYRNPADAGIIAWRDLMERLVFSVIAIIDLLPDSYWLDHRGRPQPGVPGIIRQQLGYSDWPMLMDDFRIYFMAKGYK